MQEEMKKINEMAIKLNEIATKAFDEIDIEDKEQIRLLAEMVGLSHEIKFQSEMALRFQ